MKKILLHTCCAPCSAPIIEWMINNDFSPTIFFFNPNIYPLEEYLKRKEECVKYVKFKELDFIDGDYEHEKWLKEIEGLESEPERGLRCLKCFKTRLAATAVVASQHNYEMFTTTLSGSRWKDLSQIIEAGKWAESLVDRTKFWDKDWKKGGLTERRKILLLENDFYNQQYCGCEFSIRSKE